MAWYSSPTKLLQLSSDIIAPKVIQLNINQSPLFCCCYFCCFLCLPLIVKHFVILIFFYFVYPSSALQYLMHLIVSTVTHALKMQFSQNIMHTHRADLNGIATRISPGLLIFLLLLFLILCELHALRYTIRK